MKNKTITFEGLGGCGKTTLKNSILRKYSISSHHLLRDDYLKVAKDFNIDGKSRFFIGIIGIINDKHDHLIIESFYYWLYDISRVYNFDEKEIERHYNYIKVMMSISGKSLPCLSFLLDVPYEVALQRRLDRDKASEEESKRFWDYSKKFPVLEWNNFWKWLSERVPIKIIDATQTADCVFNEVEKYLLEEKIIDATNINGVVSGS